MSARLTRRSAVLGAAATAMVLVGVAFRPASSGGHVALSHLVLDVPKGGGEQAVVFSGGCFWGVQAVFEHVRGVVAATAGYAGGSAETATYALVSTGMTGHAESVRVVYDPSQVSFGALLQVFFSVAHDPTQLEHQGPDHGTQYRSAIWYTTDAQREAARAYIRELTASNAFARPIVTEVNALVGFYPAETYHQDYLVHHPNEPYIVFNDIPKLEALEDELPALWREHPVAWHADAVSRSTP